MVSNFLRDLEIVLQLFFVRGGMCVSLSGKIPKISNCEKRVEYIVVGLEKNVIFLFLKFS